MATLGAVVIGANTLARLMPQRAPAGVAQPGPLGERPDGLDSSGLRTIKSVIPGFGRHDGADAALS